MKLRIRCSVLSPQPDEMKFDWFEDAIIHISDNQIEKIEPASLASVSDIHLPDHLAMPGFVDSHIHFPQTRIIGSASGALLPWLNASVFPEESRFEDRNYASAVANQFCNALLRHGTVAAGIYSSSHFQSTDELCDTLSHTGIKAIVGMTLMDRNAPENLCRDIQYTKDHTEHLIEKWHQHNFGQLQYAITPRFAIACSEPLLDLAGQLSATHQLWMQTHLSENTDEVQFAAELYPKSKDYLGIYEDFGLLHERSIFAHCIHLSDNEWKRLIDAKSVVAHCADSNFFLGSGCMPLANATSSGARITMGTDVGAGRSFSLRLTTSRSYDASLICGHPVYAEQLLYHATAGGYAELGFGHSLQAKGQADFILLRRPSHSDFKNLLDQILFNREITSVEATFIGGKVRYASNVLQEVLGLT
ncbi:MAG: guanine deaminase [Myxococcota bacterium]|nr:guanine deaminase [Myxococcota bacterium]